MENSWRNRLKSVGRNIFPGFVVSLVALPLSLGLAMAAGVPPMAGIITAIVGGVLVAFLGGSHVAIVGPGNGLVVVTLTAVTSLGEGNMAQGYLYTLAAIVVSGGFLLLLGIFRFGKLGEFFPSSAVQGMLAAIGLIIMAKQLHLMIGEMEPSGSSTLDYLASLPSSITSIWRGEVSWLALVLGLGSLLFLIVYPRFRNPVVQIIPAPMWVVLAGIAITYGVESYPAILPPLQGNLLVQLPDNMWSSFAHPQFDRWQTQAFWSAVISLTFISSVESLLSMKAVDRLDPWQRRTNVNKGLRAIGMATIVSGLLGGMNVVKVIARSSVNVNQGATNRSSNFFQGIFLLLFMLLFAAQIQRIPMPSLAAILVFTGYKLTAPSVFRDVARVGKDQLIIFVITMLMTLGTGLISGITIGILVTLLSQLGSRKRVGLAAQHLLQPNTLLLQEDDDQYHLSIRGFSNFLNFSRIKKDLDTLPLESKVIVDFTLTDFVDYTVLEQVHEFASNFRKRGGDLEIIGLDNMQASAAHPLADRQNTSKASTPSRSRKVPVTHRQKSIRLFAQKLDWEFDPSSDYSVRDFRGFRYFSTRTVEIARNRTQGWQGKVKIVFADLHYHEGEVTVRQRLHSTMVEIILPENIPTFVLNKENLLDRVAALAGFQDISFNRYPDFSRRFKLQGEDAQDIRRFFDRDIIGFFEENNEYHVESNGKALLIFEKERLSTIREIKQLVSFANRFAALLNTKLPF